MSDSMKNINHRADGANAAKSVIAGIEFPRPTTQEELDNAVDWWGGFSGVMHGSMVAFIGLNETLNLLRAITGALEVVIEESKSGRAGEDLGEDLDG